MFCAEELIIWRRRQSDDNLSPIKDISRSTLPLSGLPLFNFASVQSGLLSAYNISQ